MIKSDYAFSTEWNMVITDAQLQKLLLLEKVPAQKIPVIVHQAIQAAPLKRAAEPLCPVLHKIFDPCSASKVHNVRDLIQPPKQICSASPAQTVASGTGTFCDQLNIASLCDRVKTATGPIWNQLNSAAQKTFDWSKSAVNTIVGTWNFSPLGVPIGKGIVLTAATVGLMTIFFAAFMLRRSSQTIYVDRTQTIVVPSNTEKPTNPKIHDAIVNNKNGLRDALYQAAIQQGSLNSTYIQEIQSSIPTSLYESIIQKYQLSS